MYFAPDAFYEYGNSRIYFSGLGMNRINDIIHISNDEYPGRTNFYNNLPVKGNHEFYTAGINVFRNCGVNFKNDKITVGYVSAAGKNGSFVFTNDELGQYSLRSSGLIDNFFRKINDISYKLTGSGNVFFNVLLWFAVSFFLLSLSQLINIKNYPFLSFIYNFLFLILFYMFFMTLSDIYQKFVSRFVTGMIFRETALSAALIFAAIVMLIFKNLFFKSQVWEEE